MAIRVAAAGGGNWTATGTWVGGVVPTAADDVQLTNTSGNVTINAASVCRSLDCTGYTGTLAHTAAMTLTIGDATAGANNSALKFVAGMTYTLGNSATSAITFISTSTTQQSVDYAGKTLGIQTFSGVAGSWILQSAMIMAQTATNQLILTAGTLNTNSQTLTLGQVIISGTTARTFTLGGSTVDLISNSGGQGVWNATTVTNLTFNAGTSTINVNAVNQTFSGGGLTYNSVAFVVTAGGTLSVTGTNTFASSTISLSGASRISFSGNQTVTGALSITSLSSTNMGQLISSVVGTARTLSAATITTNDVNFQDISAGGVSAPWTGSNLGDMGGNSNITFTTAVTRYWVAVTGGNWNATSSWSTSSGGASGASIPLPQDTVVFDANSITSTGRTINVNVQCIADLDFTNITNSPTINMSISNGQLFVKGSLKLKTGLTATGSSPLYFSARSVQNIITAGVSLANLLQFNGAGGTYTLQDNLTVTNQVNLNYGTLNANNFNVTSTVFNSSNGNVRTLTMGSGTWTLTGNGVVWTTTTNSNLTLNADTSTIVVADTGSLDKTVALGNPTYYNVSITPGGTGRVIFSQKFIVNDFNMTGGSKTLQFTQALTYTVNGSFNVAGTVGNLVALTSVTPASQYTLSKASGTVSSDYLSIQDSNATGGAGWYAGANSTNAGNNTGWIFSAPPVSGKGLLLMGVG